MKKSITFIIYSNNISNYIVWYSNKIPQITHKDTNDMSFYIHQDDINVYYRNYNHDYISKSDFKSLLNTWQGS